MTGAQRVVKPPMARLPVIVRVDQHLPLILQQISQDVLSVERQLLRKVPQMKHNHKPPAGQRCNDFDDVYMRWQGIRDLPENPLARCHRGIIGIAGGRNVIPSRSGMSFGPPRSRQSSQRS